MFSDPYLRQLSLFGGLANFALDGYAAVMVVFLVRVVGLSAGPVGVLLAVPGVGGLAGALAARRVAARLGTARTMLASTLCTLPFALLAPLAAAGPRLAFYVAGILVAATGVGVANVIQATFRQTYCAPGILGRVTATMRFVTFDHARHPRGVRHGVAYAPLPWPPGPARSVGRRHISAGADLGKSGSSTALSEPTVLQASAIGR